MVGLVQLWFLVSSFHFPIMQISFKGYWLSLYIVVTGLNCTISGSVKGQGTKHFFRSFFAVIYHVMKHDILHHYSGFVSFATVFASCICTRVSTWYCLVNIIVWGVHWGSPSITLLVHEEAKKQPFGKTVWCEESSHLENYILGLPLPTHNHPSYFSLYVCWFLHGLLGEQVVKVWPFFSTDSARS